MRTAKRWIALLSIVSLVLGLAACGGGGGARAATMRLRKTEGTVRISDSEGQGLEVREDLGLYAGYSLRTRKESYAWVDLDSVKLTKLDQETRAEIQKEGRDLEILVKEGGLFFHVTAPLAEDESLTIRTSTMAVGIRGTCGWVEVPKDEGIMRACLLEGEVRCEADGEKETVKAGEMAVMTEDGEITVKELALWDVPDFVLEEVREDEELCERVREETGLDLLAAGGGGDSALYAGLERVVYYGDPSRCTMMPEQAAAFAQVIREQTAALEEMRAQQDPDLYESWIGEPLSAHPNEYTAALFDLGDGTPALMFSGGLLDRKEGQHCFWRPFSRQGIWLYEDGAAVQYAPDSKKQALFGDHLLTGGRYEDDVLYAYRVYPIAGGQIASQPSMTAAVDLDRDTPELYDQVYIIDGQRVPFEEFETWMSRWVGATYVPSSTDWDGDSSLAGFSDSTDIVTFAWGMGPADDLLAVLDELAGELAEGGPAAPALPADGDRIVFRGTIGLYDYDGVLALQGEEDNGYGYGDRSQMFRLIVLDEPQSMTLRSGDGDGSRQGEVTLIDVSDAQGLEQYTGQELIFSIDPEDTWWPSGVSLPLGQPWTGDVRILG